MSGRHTLFALLGLLALGLAAATVASAAPKVILAEDFGSPS